MSAFQYKSRFFLFVMLAAVSAPAHAQAAEKTYAELVAQAESGDPATDYTARIIPHHDGLITPLEAGWILWQR